MRNKVKSASGGQPKADPPRVEKIKIDIEKCIGCGTCIALCDKCFKLDGGVSHPLSENCQCPDCDLQEIADACPVRAITIEK